MRVVWSYAGCRVSGFDELLGRYGVREFKSPRRSTIPLLAYWSSAERRAKEWSEELSFALSDAIHLDFEYKVPVQRGRGRASCTDLRLTTGAASVAIEAKLTEPRYEDVNSWLNRSDRLNRRKVLEGWLDRLQVCATTKLRLEYLAELPYQMIHRAASACCLDAENRWLVYQVFDASKGKWNMYLADLRTLAKLLGERSTLRICVAGCSLTRTDRQIELEQRWENGGERDLVEPVLEGLRHGDLFRVSLKRFVVL